jgi:two-component sensor histidine kinase
MLDESINLLEELDNVSRIHILERDDIDSLMLEFAKRILVVLKIERLNIWLFNPEKDTLVSIAEYDTRTQLFSKNSTLLKKDFPAYFEAIGENKIVLAPNINKHPGTFQFQEIYSKPNDIISLMDVPLRMEGQLIGVICFEKTGNEERNFSEKERTFALSLSTVLASNLEARHRRAQYKLEAAIKEKELLIQEINHRVKNNFSVLLGLLRLTRSEKKTKDVRTVLAEYEQRVLSILKIHELLHETKNHTSVNLTDYLKELIKEFKNSYPEIAPLVTSSIGNISKELPSKTGIHLGLLITEIFLNSVKHAFGKIENYKLSISLNEDDSQNIKLIIHDSGTGFDFEEGSKKGNMGLQLIKGLSEDVGLISKFPSKESNTYEFTLNSKAL